MSIGTLKPKLAVISNYTDDHSVRPEAEIFISLQKRGYDVTVLTFDGSYYADRFRAHGIHVIDCHPTKKYDPSKIQEICDVLTKGDFDVLHMYNNKALTNGLLASKGLAIKKIGYRGSTLNFEWWNPYNYKKHLSPQLDAVICNSEGVAAKYRSHPFFNNDKIKVINKGHDVSWYKDVTPLDLRTKYNIPTDAVIYILVATDRTMKGVKYLCQAVNHLPEKMNFRLFMIGRGMDSMKYKKILSKGPHADNVIHLAHTDEALSYVAGADVFVLPSIKGESITKAVLEAMSLGKCSLITDIAGNQELVEHMHTGLVIPKKNPIELAKAMEYVCNNKDAIIRFGNASQQRISSVLSHQTTVDKYEDLYKSL